MPYGISTSELATTPVLPGLLGIVGLVSLWRYGRRGAGVAAVCGALLVILGYYLYAWAAPQRELANSALGRIAAFFDAHTASAVQLVNQAYYLSLASLAWNFPGSCCLLA